MNVLIDKHVHFPWKIPVEEHLKKNISLKMKSKIDESLLSLPVEIVISNLVMNSTMDSQRPHRTIKILISI